MFWQPKQKSGGEAAAPPMRPIAQSVSGVMRSPLLMAATSVVLPIMVCASALMLAQPIAAATAMVDNVLFIVCLS